MATATLTCCWRPPTARSAHTRAGQHPRQWNKTATGQYPARRWAWWGTNKKSSRPPSREPAKTTTLALQTPRQYLQCIPMTIGAWKHNVVSALSPSSTVQGATGMAIITAPAVYEVVYSLELSEPPTRLGLPDKNRRLI